MVFATKVTVNYARREVFGYVVNAVLGPVVEAATAISCAAEVTDAPMKSAKDARGGQEVDGGEIPLCAFVLQHYLLVLPLSMASALKTVRSQDSSLMIRMGLKKLRFILCFYTA